VAERRLLVRAVAADARTLVVSVVDSGTGLSPWATERLFKPFQTTKPGGLGLGLPICRSIIEAHGGEIWAENNPQGGATFSFSLKTRTEPEP
jgi:signal transduction histidine kinase